MKRKHLQTNLTPPPSKNRGFSLVECVIALLVLMVVALSIGAVINFSQSNSRNARGRFGALLLAQQRMEDIRNTPFSSLTAGTATENNVINDGVVYRVVRTITETDIINTTEAPGPETKRIVISVNQAGNTLPGNTVTLTAVRAVNRPGPKKIPNPTT